ncbi:MAG: hypothetical protein ABR987_04170 [Terracidiphilus sp.]|jgi:hypothetical protein
MERMWRIRAEIEVEPGDLDLDDGYTKGFMNVVTWASTDQLARGKLTAYLATLNWKLLGVEESFPMDPIYAASDSEVNELVDMARGNPNAIVLGTMHSYLEK